MLIAVFTQSLRQVGSYDLVSKQATFSFAIHSIYSLPAICFYGLYTLIQSFDNSVKDYFEMALENIHQNDLVDNPYLEDENEDDTPLLRRETNFHPRSKRKPPPLVRSLNSEERKEVERSLVRKIDVRLIPMLIIMYVLASTTFKNVYLISF